VHTSDRTVKVAIVFIAIVLGVQALRSFIEPVPKVLAQSARFDHVTIMSAGFLYKGQQGLLVLDKRNGNVWFYPKVNDAFQDPVFVMRMQFEKIDQEPR
jgi:hypothetical protein